MVARALSSFSRCLMSIHRARAAAAEPEAMAWATTVRAFMALATGVTAGFMRRAITAAMVVASMARATTADIVVGSIGGATNAGISCAPGGAVTRTTEHCPWADFDRRPANPHQQGVASR